MKVNQIYSLINSVSAQVWGTAAPTVQDLSGIISLGKKVGANGVWNADSDKYLGTLIDRIGKTVLRTLDTRVDFPNLIKESFEFGAVLQKIDVQPVAATNDNSWNVGADDFTSNYLSVYKPTIDSTLFSGINTWTVKTTIPDKLFTSAFDSESGMTSFVNAIIDSLTNSLEAQFNKVSHLAVCNFIAEKKKNSNGVINLVTMYNTAMGYTSESAGYQPIGKSALYNKDFLQYASNVINNYIDYMGDDGTFFNAASLAFTSTVCMVSGTRGMTTSSRWSTPSMAARSATASSIRPVRRDCILALRRLSRPRMAMVFSGLARWAAACIFWMNSGSLVCISFIGGTPFPVTAAVFLPAADFR